MYIYIIVRVLVIVVIWSIAEYIYEASINTHMPICMSKRYAHRHFDMHPNSYQHHFEAVRRYHNTVPGLILGRQNTRRALLSSKDIRGVHEKWHLHEVGALGQSVAGLLQTQTAGSSVGAAWASFQAFGSLVLKFASTVFSVRVHVIHVVEDPSNSTGSLS